MTTQFQNTGEHLYTFADVFFVRCPVCSSCATVRKIEPELAHSFSQREASGPYRLHGVICYARLICRHCGHIKDLKTDGYAYGSPTDWYFNLPLWFQMPCCGETLWATIGLTWRT